MCQILYHRDAKTGFLSIVQNSEDHNRVDRHNPFWFFSAHCLQSLHSGITKAQLRIRDFVFSDI